MPFDGEVQKFETQADVFSLQGLVAWLETQDPEATYNFDYAEGCLLTRFFKAHGGNGFYWVDDGACGYRDNHGRLVVDSYEHPFFSVAIGTPRTFSAALTRARAALATTA